jgi:copper transport protein
MRPFLALALTVAAASALAPPAAAHAVLLHTEPPDGSILAVAPTAVRLVFDNGVHPASGNQVIRNGGGSVLAGAPHIERGRMLVLPLEPRLAAGDYSVRWRVISDDGHHESGVLAFAVGAGRGPPLPELEAGGGLAASTVAARALFFAGLLLAAGTAAFGLAVGRERSTGLLLLAGLTLAAGGAAWLASSAAGGTRFGDAYTAGATVALVGAGLAAAGLWLPPLVRTAEVAALVLVLVPTMAGHALDAGQPTLVEATADVLHVMAASVWVGGLAALLLTLRSAHGREYARRFSSLALIAVGVLAATGVVRALDELSAVDQLVTTGYGRALLVKTGLVVAALALAWRNRARLLARDGTRTLERSVGGETALLAAAVVAVAFLTALPPGKDATAASAAPATAAPARPPRPPAGALVLAREDRRLAVALAVRGRELTATVLSPDGGGFRGLDVSFRSNGRLAVALPCGAGCYRAALAHGRSVDVVFPGSAVAFRLPRGAAPPAAGIIRRAGRVFRGLSSVVLQERLSSGTHTVTTRFVLAAPDRLTYRTDTGPAAIVIGRRRWDREGRGPWVESPQSPLAVPVPFWSGQISNARLIDRGGGVDVVSFFDRQLTAWFQARIDRRTGRTLGLSMIAGAHFMHHRYSAFNAPVRIAPPP